MDPLSTLSVLGVLCVALAWFARLERTGRSVTVVIALWVLLIADSVIYPSQNEIPAGLFHPVIYGVSFRPVDVLIPLAVAARLRARGLPERIERPHFAWIAFLIWVLTSAVVGALNGNSLHFVTFESKVIIYLSAIGLAAGVPAREYLDRGRLLHLLQGAAVVALAMLLLDAAGVSLSLNLPALPIQDFGRLDSDAATIFASLGAIALGIGIVVDDHRLGYLLPAAPLLASPLAANQTAALLGLATSLVLIAALGFSAGRRRLSLTATEATLGGLAVAGCLLVTVVLGTAAEGKALQLPFQNQVSGELGGTETTLTTENRRNEWRQARLLIGERPVFGWGLGKTYVFYEPGFKQFERIDLTHNIVLDLLLRTGAVGLLLFLVALSLAFSGALRIWNRLPDDALAGLALGVIAAALALLAKGMVESIFEKYRLAVLLGLLVGMMLALGQVQQAPRGIRENP